MSLSKDYVAAGMAKIVFSNRANFDPKVKLRKRVVNHLTEPSQWPVTYQIHQTKKNVKCQL